MEHHEQIRAIKELLTRLDAGTNVDAGGQRRNPTSVYVDTDLAQREWQMFFRGHPQLIGLSGDLPSAGSFMTVDDFGTPIIAVRGEDGMFRAMVNACRHRGARVVSEARGAHTRFSCPFHAWTYDTKGALVGVPKEDHFGRVDRACSGLQPLPALERHGLLWVHPDPNGSIDTEALLTPALAREFDAWRLGDLQYVLSDSYDVRCNWKLAMDTFGETYHFPVLHKNSLHPYYHGNVQCYDTFGRNHRMLLCRREIDAMRKLPESAWHITTATLPAYWLFPNVQLLPSPDGCFLVRAYPIPGEPGRHVSRVTFYQRPFASGVPFDVRFNENVRAVAEAFAALIRDEDYVMSASQQANCEARALEYSVFGRNEPALHHYHNTYREVLGLPLLHLEPDQERAA
jgi:phenylpropionate dioxygenase-like ring-hydroxylating dioxygenase large terminal subunit